MPIPRKEIVRLTLKIKKDDSEVKKKEQERRDFKQLFKQAESFIKD